MVGSVSKENVPSSLVEDEGFNSMLWEYDLSAPFRAPAPRPRKSTTCVGAEWQPCGLSETCVSPLGCVLLPLQERYVLLAGAT